MDIFILILAVLIAYTVKGLCGFANTLVFTNIAGFKINNLVLTPIELLISFPADLIMAYKNRKKINIKMALFLSIIVFSGTVLGAVLLKGSDSGLLKIIFGIVVIVAACEMYLRSRNFRKYKQNVALATIIGLVSGILCGLFGVGALLVAYIIRTTDDMESFKGTLNIVYTVNNILRIIIYTSTGILTAQAFKTFIYLVPFMLIGLFLGMHLSKKMPDAVVKKYIFIFLFISGASLIITNIIW